MQMPSTTTITRGNVGYCFPHTTSSRFQPFIVASFPRKYEEFSISRTPAPMDGSIRIESRQHRHQHRQQHRHRHRRRRVSIASQTLQMRWLVYSVIFFVLGTLSIGRSACTAFPLKKSTFEKTEAKQKITAQIDPKSSPSSISIPSCIGRLSVPNQGTAKDPDSKTTVNYHVIGTSHFRCDSYKEVSDLIRRVNPDGVVIELDPERLLRLTLDDASVRLTEAATTNGTGVEAMELIGKRWFGGDFLSAIETSKELDIPIFLGDEYPIETKQRFVDTVFDVESYNPRKLLAAVRSMFRARLDRTTNPHSEIRLVDVVGTFFEDPRKLLPLAATLSLPFLTVLFALAFDAKIATATEVSPDDGLLLDHSFEVLATLLSSLISFFAACKVFNNLIADRDLVVASNIQRAATTMTLLNSNQLIRKRWTFSVTESVDGHEPEQLGGIPLFTLKNPLERNAVRNLNLFEPRWLKMIDRLMLLSNPQRGQHPNGAALTQDTEPPATSSGSENRIIGCVTCTNKFYSAINLAETSQTSNSNPGSFVEGRYADVIFRRRGRFGELKSVTEGSRPSGARKVGAKIVGKESFDLSSSVNGDGTDEISVTPEGYLTALNLTPIDEDESSIDIETKDILDEINIVVVVGLLHANGILENLSRHHDSTTTVQR